MSHHAIHQSGNSAYGTISDSKPSLVQFVVHEHSLISMYARVWKGLDAGRVHVERGKSLAVVALSIVLPLWLCVLATPDTEQYFWWTAVIAAATAGALYGARRAISVSVEDV